jgi:hypothetical protein
VIAVQMDCLADAAPSYRAGSAAGYRPKSERSKAAAAHVDKDLKSRQTLVLVAVQVAGSHGITCRELAARWQVGLHTLSGRFTELHTRGHIKRNGETRDNCSVWVVA